ncbi:MAG: response regulator transcription factor [Phycisphaerae bacterium]
MPNERKETSYPLLAVDDETLILESYRRILNRNRTLLSDQQADIVLTTCRRASAAIEAMEQACSRGEPFAMALLDIRMPEMDGIELAEQLRKLDENCHFVLVSGHSDVPLAQVSQMLGAPDKLLYLQKPFHALEICQVTAAICSKWDSEKKLRSHAEDLAAEVQAQTAELEAANARLREQVQRKAEQEKQLSRQLAELERFNRLTVGRELRMVELKREVNDMAIRLGLEAPYELALATEIEAQAGQGQDKWRTRGSGGQVLPESGR